MGLPVDLHEPLDVEVGVLLRHQTGRKDAEPVRAAYVAAGYAEECVSAFIDDMAEAYAWADLVLCRAGATSVAELAAGCVRVWKGELPDA